MTQYGIINTRSGAMLTNLFEPGVAYESRKPWLMNSFEEAVKQAEGLSLDCTVVELVPRATIRHERTHRIIIDPLL